MRHTCYRYLFALILPFFFIQALNAQVILTDSATHISAGRQAFLLEDTSHQLRSLRQVTGQPFAAQFARSNRNIPNEGYSTSDYWVRFDVSNRATVARSWLLEIAFGNYSEIDLYILSKRTGKLIHKRGGENLGVRGREISYNTYVFHLPTSPGDEQTIYIRLSSTFGQATFPLYIWQNDAFVQQAQVSGLLWGVYYGILVSVFLYHLLLLLLARERSHIMLLTIYLGFYILWELSRGYCLGVRFLWPGNKWLTEHSLSTAFTLLISSFLLFYSSVLYLRQVAPRLNAILHGLIAVSVMGWLITLLNLPGVSQNLVISVIGMANGLFIVFLGGYSWYQGMPPARYYWGAAMMLVVGGIIQVFHRAGLIPDDGFWVQYTLNLGAVLEFILLTVGLADTMRQEKKKRQELRREMAHREEAAELRGLTEERQRVSSEIHDNVGNSLLTLRQSVRGLQSETNTTIAYEKLERMVQETYEEVRKIVNNLLPDEFQQKGMAVALQELIETLNETKQTQFYLLLSGSEQTLKPSTQFQLYLVILELLNNIIKHAQATEASIRSIAANNKLTITIRDNGIGFSASSPGSGGQGWRTIRNRLMRIDGSIHVEPLIDKGTSVVVQVPLTDHPDQLAYI